MAHQTFFKDPVPYRVRRQKVKDQRKADEDKAKQEALKRDGRKCRWPRCEYRKIAQPIDPAHVLQAKGMGGDPKRVRSQRHHIMALCRLHHDRQERHDLDVEGSTNAGTDGPCAFYQRDPADGHLYMVAQETAIRQYARD